MGARQHAEADLDRTYRAGVTAVDARLAVEDLAAHDLGLQVEQDPVDRIVVRLRCRGGRGVFLEPRPHSRVDVVDLVRAGLLVARLVGVAQFRPGEQHQLGEQRLVLRWGLPLPRRLAGIAHQFVDRIYRRLHLAMPVHDGAQHDLLGQLIGLDSTITAFGSGDNEVELRVLQLRAGRVEHVLAVDVGDACCTDRSLERDTRQRQGGRGADHRRDVRVDLGVARQHVDDDLDFVEEAIGKQWSNWTIDQARGQRLLLRGTALALEEAAGDATRCVGLLDIIDGQREKILSRLGLLARDHGGEHDGVVHGADDGAARLACDLARLKRHGMGAVREFLGDLFKHLAFLSCLLGSAARDSDSRRTGTPRYRRLGAEYPSLRPYRGARAAGQRQTACGDYPRRRVHWRPGHRLLAQSEAVDEPLVRLRILAFQVVEQLAAAADHLQQTTP